jgi:signal transduction histidine kinase
VDKRRWALLGLLLGGAAVAPLAPDGIPYSAAVLSWLPAVALRRWPLPALALMLAAGVATMVAFPAPAVAYLQVGAQDLAVLAIAAGHRRRVSVPAAAGALVVQVAAGFLAVYGENVLSLRLVGVLALAMIAAWTVGWSLRERRERQEMRRVQALADERLRIARDVHDLVAHSIGIIAIQAGVGRRVIDTQPAEARAALATIEETSRETLAGLRRTVGALRGGTPLDPAPGLADVAALGLADVAALGAVGVRLDVRHTGAPRSLPADLELAAYRVVQEAVTNVARHAGTGAARVTIGYDGPALTVEVVDDGRGGPADADGFGLAGMRERVAAFGGGLTAGPRPEGGWRVVARLPVP